jgi:DNA-binding NarL/FixJ family response regulator
MKEAPPEELVAALRRIMAGQVYLGERMTRAVLDKLGRGEGTDLSFSPADRLTPRELAVFRLIGQGLTTRQIAAELSLSTKTIEGYAAKIKEKLGLHNFVQLQQRAALWVKAMPPEHGTPS